MIGKIDRIMKREHQSVDVANNPEAYFNQFGKLALLIGTTPQFSQVQMDIGLSQVHAALTHKTYCLYIDTEGKPAAGLLWAYMNDASWNFYLEYGLLPKKDAWRSGDQLWLLNVVANGGMLKTIIKDERETHFNNQKEAFMIRPSRDGGRRVVRITRTGAELIKILPMPKLAPEDGTAAPLG